MKGRLVLAGMTLLLACACAPSVSDRSSKFEPLEPEAFAAVFREQAACRSAWGGLIEQWKLAGGGLKASIVETRHQIAADKDSDFARLVRRAWSRQAVAEPAKEFGQWPIPDDRYRSVAMAATGKGFVAKNCEGVFWLGNLFWDELRFMDGDAAKARRFAETPREMNWTSPFAQQWTAYWLFARVGE